MNVGWDGANKPYIYIYNNSIFEVYGKMQM